MQVAHYNKQQAMQAEIKRRRESSPKDMGNLFQNRKNPPGRSSINQENAQEILKQIQRRKVAENLELEERLKMDKKLSNQFVQKYAILNLK